MTDLFLLFIFFCTNPFLLYLVAQVGEVSNMYGFSIYIIFWTSTCLLVDIGFLIKI